MLERRDPRGRAGEIRLDAVEIGTHLLEACGVQVALHLQLAQLVEQRALACGQRVGLALEGPDAGGCPTGQGGGLRGVGWLRQAGGADSAKATTAARDGRRHRARGPARGVGRASQAARSQLPS